MHKFGNSRNKDVKTPYEHQVEVVVENKISVIPNPTLGFSFKLVLDFDFSRKKASALPVKNKAKIFRFEFNC